MAALWRRAVQLSFRSCACLLFSIKPAVPKSSKLLFSGVASGLSVCGLCAVPFKQADDLSHDSLVRRAASLVTDSSSTFLSQTTLALIDAITDYSKAVHTLISLQKRYLDSLGKLSPAEEDAIWQVIINQRTQVNDRQDACRRFQSTWFTAVKLCEVAAEAAYVSGVEQASVTVRTNIQLAQSQVEEAQKISQDAEKKLTEMKVMEVQRMSQYATSENNNEEEMPEAYLRED